MHLQMITIPTRLSSITMCSRQISQSDCSVHIKFNYYQMNNFPAKLYYVIQLLKFHLVDYSFKFYGSVITNLFDFERRCHCHNVIVVRITYTYTISAYHLPLTLWVRIPLMARCTRYNIMWKSLSVTCDRSVAFSVYSGFFH